MEKHKIFNKGNYFIIEKRLYREIYNNRGIQIIKCVLVKKYEETR